MTARPARKRLWRKRLTRATLCLLLGAATTVGVAWGLARPWGAAGSAEVEVALKTSEQWWVIRCEHRRFDSRVRVFNIRCWHHRFETPEEARDSHRRELTPAVGVLIRSPSPSAHIDNAMTDTVRDVPFYGGVYEDVSRTPIAIALRASWARFPAPSNQPDWFTTIAAGYPCRSLRGSWNKAETWTAGAIDVGDRRLPWHPILPGFLLNTLLYAAPWWLILVTPSAIRRFRRRRRGRCIYCGYDLTGLPRDDNTTPTCPECGA